MGTPPGGGVREKEQTQSNRSAARCADMSKDLTCLAIILAPWPGGSHLDLRLESKIKIEIIAQYLSTRAITNACHATSGWQPYMWTASLDPSLPVLPPSLPRTWNAPLSHSRAI